MYKRTHYAGCGCGNVYASIDQRYGQEPGQMTAGLEHLLALSGIDCTFEKRQEWMSGYKVIDENYLIVNGLELV